MSPPMSQESLKAVLGGTPVRHLTLTNLKRKIPRYCQIIFLIQNVTKILKVVMLMTYVIVVRQ